VPSYSRQGIRVRAVAAFGGLDVAVAESSSSAPLGKTTSFQTASGAELFETAAIARYVAASAKNATLLGSSPEEEAQIDQWTVFADSELYAYGEIVKVILAGKIPYTKPADTYLRDHIKKALTVIESHLGDRTYLVTERITLADISVASVLKYLFEYLVDASDRKALPHTLRFYETISNNPTLKPVFGETAYAEKAAQFTPPAKPKKEAAAPAAPKEKPAPKPKAAEPEDDDDEPTVEEPKAKNPLDSLPKSNFNLEDWKRAYSNMDTRGAGGSLEWFYDKFDKEGFSIWRVDFKYNSELTLTFMSSNQIGGFFNRLEGSRKYLFGSMGVLGANNDSVISGVLILRGLDHKPVVEVAPDWESYEYKAINLEDAADKAFFEAALAWDLEIDGKKWADGKNFK